MEEYIEARCKRDMIQYDRVSLRKSRLHQGKLRILPSAYYQVPTDEITRTRYNRVCADRVRMTWMG
jgi:hypothetical protein